MSLFGFHVLTRVSIYFPFIHVYISLLSLFVLMKGVCVASFYIPILCVCFFLSLVWKTQTKHWTKWMVRTRLAT